MKDQSKSKVHVEGRAPLTPGLAGLLDEAPALLDQLASEFAPVATQLSTPQAYWIAFNAWVTNRLSAPIMAGEVKREDLSGQAWAVYATAYWGGMELRENWGMPPAMARLGITTSPPFAEPLQGVADALARRMAALKGGSAACLEIASALLHEDSGYGALWNTAYNAGCQVIKTEDPPLGQRRPHRKPKPSFVRINARDFMRVDYELPSPDYLRIWRSAFQRAVMTNPQAYEAEIAGASGQTDLRAIWKRGVEFGNTSWGDGANDAWTEAYFNESLHWSTVVNFGLEAMSLAAFVAILNNDAEAAKAAVMENFLYAGMATGWLLGFLDTGETLATVTPALSS